MLTHADVCCIYVCWRMLTYTASHSSRYPLASVVLVLQLLLVYICWRMLTYAVYTYADVCWRMLTYADVCCIYVCWRMLTYADVYRITKLEIPTRLCSSAAAVPLPHLFPYVPSCTCTVSRRAAVRGVWGEYIYIYIHTYIHTYKHTYIRIYIHKYIHTYTYNILYTYTVCVCIYRYICIYMYIYTCTYIYIWILYNINTHTHTCQETRSRCVSAAGVCARAVFATSEI